MTSATIRAIAESMGWHIDWGEHEVAPGIKLIICHIPNSNIELRFSNELDFTADTPMGNWLSKKLQARLVEEGWDIVIHMDIFRRFEIVGKKGEIKIRLGYFTQHINENNNPEAQAIAHLYCRVKNIKEE